VTTREKLLHRRSVAEFVQGICGFLLLGPPVLLVLLILMLPASPEAGFTGIRLIFGWGMWWPVLLIPLVGFFVARSRAADFKQRLEDLPDEDDRTNNGA
jgi:uncharacterized membrane protein (DUF4010 family)